MKPHVRSRPRCGALAAALTAAFMLLQPVHARAQNCESACATDRRACAFETRFEHADARAACDAARFDCREHCDGARNACRAECDGAGRDCRAECSTSVDPEACRGACSVELTTCRDACGEPRADCRSGCDTDRRKCRKLAGKVRAGDIDACGEHHDACADGCDSDVTCANGCGMVARACFRDARTTLHACRGECAPDGSGRGCRQTCRVERVIAQVSCTAVLRGCLADCGSEVTTTVAAPTTTTTVLEPESTLPSPSTTIPDTDLPPSEPIGP